MGRYTIVVMRLFRTFKVFCPIEIFMGGYNYSSNGKWINFRIKYDAIKKRDKQNCLKIFFLPHS